MTQGATLLPLLVSRWSCRPLPGQQAPAPQGHQPRPLPQQLPRRQLPLHEADQPGEEGAPPEVWGTGAGPWRPVALQELLGDMVQPAIRPQPGGHPLLKVSYSIMAWHGVYCATLTRADTRGTSIYTGLNSFSNFHQSSVETVH